MQEYSYIIKRSNNMRNNETLITLEGLEELKRELEELKLVKRKEISGQRSPPTYYRGCWHVVSRGFLLGYRHFLRHQGQSFTIRRPSSLTRRRCIRVPSIVQYSPLLPPVGVWTVSQFQCGRSPSQAGY
jgi:hypothetical protein